MHFITLLTHMYLDYSQVGNVKYQITKKGDSNKHDKFLTDYFKLNSIQIYSTISHCHFDKIIKKLINVPLNRICNFFSFTMDCSFVHSVVEITDRGNHGPPSLS